MYRKDTAIPSHGRRTKEENTGTVLVKISRWPDNNNPGSNGFDFYLNIIPATMTYNAAAESVESSSERRLVTSVDIPSEALERMVRLAQNNDFMSIKNADIFPDKDREMGHYLQNQKDGNGKHFYLFLKELSVRFKGIVPTRAGALWYLCQGINATL